MFYSNKAFIPLLFFLLSLGTLFSQENVTAYWQPSIALNYPVSKNYTHNFSIQNRNYVYEETRAQLSVRQLDAVHFSNLKLQNNTSLALGILYRFRETFDGGANELRFTQQYNFTSKPFIIRYGHRIRSEQRITSSIVIQRFRYRFSIDSPLQGEKLDIGEPYLVTNLEQLLSVGQNERPQYDIRLTLHLGWKLNDLTKIQFGAEYRSEDYSNEVQHVLFFLSTLNISL